ncbi:MAG TPA: DUF6384 family protein, partial [Candidatus Sulfotelmatobacter sp.]|nr:DUF6384 family protein [Candidatus Sulfotelmatobacter sp.]
ALSEQNKLETAARNWALLVGNSRFLEPSSRWHQDIQQKLDTAKGYLQAGQWAEATAALGAAQQFLGDWHGWQQAQESLQKAIAAAKLCPAKEEAARSALAQALSQAQQAATQENRQASQQALQKLQEVTGQINSQYTLQIVCRNGQRTAVERTHDQSGGKRWYLIVEALNERGQALPQTIKNRETGEVLTTTLWGEEIPQELYNKIYNEKKSTGAVEDLSFGKKEAGYLEPRYTRIAGSTHRITSW